jgi:peptidoglycan/xylan/chitin deacetylase (PgdA/CDA1 family)
MWRRSVALLFAFVLAVPAASAKAPPGDAPTQLQQLVWKGIPIFCGGDARRLVALTFDDGPGPWTLPLVAALRRTHTPATFFLVGNRIPFWPQGAHAAARAGALGNHTWSHPHLRRLEPRAVDHQLRTTQIEILEATRQLPAVFRPPYEESTRRIDRIAQTLGLVDVRWSVDSGDASGAQPGAIVRNVLAAVRPGSIVLLHDAHAWNPAVVRAIVRGLRARRLRPVTVPALFELDPPTRRAECR